MKRDEDSVQEYDCSSNHFDRPEIKNNIISGCIKCIDAEHGRCNIALWQQVVLTVLSRRGETIGLIGERVVESRGDTWRGLF